MVSAVVRLGCCNIVSYLILMSNTFLLQRKLRMICCQKAEFYYFVRYVQSNPSVIAMFLSFTSNDILLQKIPCFRDCPVYCRILSSIPGPQLLHANSTLQVVRTPKCVQKLPYVLLGSRRVKQTLLQIGDIIAPMRGPLFKGKSELTPKLRSFLGLPRMCGAFYEVIPL